jgi:hypothetical protein
MKTALDHAMHEYLHILHMNANKGTSGIGGVGLSPSLIYLFEVEPGRKFLKITKTLGGTNRSVHCFVDKATGDIYKPASWKTPVKDTRYNLFRDMGLLHKVADPHGGYLYKSTAEANHA